LVAESPRKSLQSLLDRSRFDESAGDCDGASLLDKRACINLRAIRVVGPTRAVSLAAAPSTAPNKGRKAKWGRVTVLSQSGHSQSPRWDPLTLSGRPRFSVHAPLALLAEGRSA